jgi:TatD DNase family protein
MSETLLGDSTWQNASYHALIPGITPSQFRELLQREELARFDAAVGWHPWYLPDEQPSPENIRELRDLADNDRVVAVGETGLDSIAADSALDEERQEQWFVEQVRLAVDLNKPLVIHCVRSHGRCFELLRETGAEHVGGVIHAYSSSPEMAEQYRTLNFAVGIGSPVTRKNSKNVRRAAAEVDEDWFLVETDAPFMNVETRPKGEGRPSNLHEVAEEVAFLRDCDQDEIFATNERNYARIFKGID